MTSERIRNDQPTPGAPRWGLSAACAALATAAVCWPAWPGLMSYDSLFAYAESRTGVTTMLWPPMHAYLFWLSRAVGAGTWGLFLAQTFLLFFAAAVSVNLLVRSRPWALAGLLAFAAAFVGAPSLLGSTMVHWRDTTTASLILAGLAAWLAGARARAPAALVLAALAFAVAAALRYNAVLLIVLLAPLMVWKPFLGAPAGSRVRLLAVAALALGLGLAWASTQWRLPDLKRLPRPDNFVGTQEFDLLGVSACADRIYLPPMLTQGWPITPRQVRMAYDPRHLQLAFRPVAGAPRIVESDAHGQVAAVWRRVVPRELGCYLDHRRAVFVHQMGLARAGVFHASQPGIDPNPYGLAPAHPATVARVNAYIESRAGEPWRRPALLYLLAAAVAAALWARASPARSLFTALLGGAFAYPAALFVAAPAADARYIFPSNVLCALIVAAGLAALLSGRRSAA